MVESEETIDWVLKLESQLYPVLNSETTNADTQLEQIDYRLNHIVPEIKHVQEEIEFRIQTAKDLIVTGDIDNDEEIPPKLHELHESICTIIKDYSSFLKMFASFLKNVKELEKKLESLKEFADELKNVDVQRINHAKVKYLEACKSFHDLWDETLADNEKLIAKIRQQESSKYADYDIATINSLFNTKQLEWDSISVSVQKILEHLQEQKQLNQELENINSNLKELTDELKSLQYQYGLSPSAAKSSSLAFQNFEKAIKLLEMKIESFLSSLEESLKDNESIIKGLEDEIGVLKDKWNKFRAEVAETKRSIDLSIEYFTLIEETEECFREGTKLLVCIAKKSCTVCTSEETEELLVDIKDFVESLEVKTEERIKNLSSLVTQLFNDDYEHSRQVARIIAENSDMLESFQSVSKELATMQAKFKSRSRAESLETSNNETFPYEVDELPRTLIDEEITDVDEAESTSSIFEKEKLICDTSIIKDSSLVNELTKQVQAPFFVSPLSAVKVCEGSKCVLQCAIKADPPLEITWYRADTSLEKDPKCQITFEDGFCKLCIEKVSVEDAAQYSCQAVNGSGIAKTSASLSVIATSYDEVLPVSKSVTNVFETSKFHEVKEASVTKSVEINGDSSLSKSDPYLSMTNDKSLELNDGEPIKTASQRTEEKLKVDEKLSHYSSQELLTGNLSTLEKISSDEQNNTALLEPVRIQMAPQFLSTLNGAVVDKGKDFKFEVNVKSYPASNIIWYKNETLLSNEQNKIRIVGELNRATLEIFNVEDSDVGRYMCLAYNDAGSASTTADLHVKKTLLPPVIGKQLHSQSVGTEEKVIFEVEVNGTPKPAVSWFRNGVQLPVSSPFYKLEEDGDFYALIFEKVRLEDGGQYKFKAHNEAGEIVSLASLYVFEPLSSTIANESHKGSVTSKTQYVTTDAVSPSDVTKSEVFNQKPKLTNGEILQIVDINKIDKSTSLLNGQKMQNDFNVSKEKHESHDSSKSKHSSVFPDTPNKTYENNSNDLTETIAYTNLVEKCTSFLNSRQDHFNDSKDSYTSESKHPVFQNAQNRTLENISNSFSKTIQTDISISFPDGQKLQDDFDISNKKQTYCDPNGSQYPMFQNTLNGICEKNSCNSTDITALSNSHPEDIETLQKPIVYTNTEIFNGYDSPNVMFCNDFIQLEPGPPPEIGYIPKEAVSKTREGMADRVKKLESSQRELSPVEIPKGAVKIFPTIVLTKKQKTDSGYHEQYSTRQNHTDCKKDETVSSTYCSQQESDIKLPQMETETLGSIYHPQVDLDVRPLSPIPSAEGVNTERLWTQKTNIEEQNCLYPTTLNNFQCLGNNSVYTPITGRKLTVSPIPSPEKTSNKKPESCTIYKNNRPYSEIGSSDSLSLKTEESLVSSIFQSVILTPGSGIPKIESSQKYENIHEINDQVASRNVIYQNLSDYGGKSYKRSFSEEKNVTKGGGKFQWPPQEVSFQDSLVRRASPLQKKEFSNNNVNPVLKPGSPPEVCCTGERSKVEKSSYVQQTETSLEDNDSKEWPKYIYSGVKVMYKNHNSDSNQTLPRSFKFTPSTNSKFKPVKSFTNLKAENTGWKPVSSSQSDFHSSNFTTDSQFAQNTSKSFGGSDFSKSVPASHSYYNFRLGNEVMQNGSLERSVSDLSGLTSCSKNLNYNEVNRTHTLPRVSDNKISQSIIDDTYVCSSHPHSSTIDSISGPSMLNTSDFRENVYSCRIPRSWHPFNSTKPAKFYRPVRLDFIPTQRLSPSVELVSKFKFVDASGSNFQPVSPLLEYSNTPFKFKPNPSFYGTQCFSTEGINNTDRNACYFNKGDIRSCASHYQAPMLQKLTDYETDYSELYEAAETENFNDLTKKQKVEQMRKQFENNSAQSSVVILPTRSHNVSRYQIYNEYPGVFKQNSRNSYNASAKKVINNVFNNVSNKQNEMKIKSNRLPSIYLPSVEHEPQIYREHCTNIEHANPKVEFGWKTNLLRAAETGGDDFPEQESGPEVAPVFLTPLHDIAAVSGSKAKFECIVQCESPFNIIWQKNDDVLQNSELCHINCRNGVCTLTLLKICLYDSGNYHCIAMNKAGVVETTACLTVSNERRSFIKK